MGADMIEFDVHALPSGEVILIHDHRVNRTTNGKGYVLEHDFGGLRALDAGQGELIPTLTEVLDFVDRRVPVNIELKGPDSAKSVAKIVAAHIRSGWQPADFMISSFDHSDLQEFKRLMPGIRVAALQDCIPLHYAAFAEELQAMAIGPSDEFVNKAYVDDAHKRGIQVYVWTVNDPEEVARMYHMGVDGIFTDVPDIARQVAEALGKKQK